MCVYVCVCNEGKLSSYMMFVLYVLCPPCQENYFGEDDMYTDFEEAVCSPLLSLSSSSSSGWTALGLEEREQREDRPAIHPLTLRPWDITVLINLHKVHGRLPVVSPPGRRGQHMDP